MKTPLRTKLTATLCLAFGSTTLISLHVSAANLADESPPMRTVSFADLDLSKPAGVHTLYRRIWAAAREVCRNEVASDLHLLGREQACMKRAIDDAVRDVNSPALAELRFGNALRLASR